MTVLGQVFELTPTDKLPSVALKTIFGVGAPLAANPEYLLIVGSKASSGGTLTADDEVRDILADGDEVTLFGDAGSEGARMVHMAQQIGGVQIKVAACSISAGVAATAKAVVDGTWTSAGTAPLQFWVGGQVELTKVEEFLHTFLEKNTLSIAQVDFLMKN
jgi:phage tail sheath gpL-like